MSRVLRCLLPLDRCPQQLHGRLVARSSAVPAKPAQNAPGAPADGPIGGGDTQAPQGVSAELRSLLESLEQTVLDAEQLRRQSLHEFQQLAVELAVTIAGELLFRAIDADQFHVGGLVAAAVERLGIDAPITIGLHPLDLRLLESEPVEQPPVWRTGTLILRPDAALPRGHCRATNGATALLSELAPRLEEIRESLWEGLDDAQIERRQAAGIGSGLKRFPDRRETA
ncbi:MAG: FliH/SctL family protein [Planctomycetaceae bacterium]